MGSTSRFISPTFRPTPSRLPRCSNTAADAPWPVQALRTRDSPSAPGTIIVGVPRPKPLRSTANTHTVTCRFRCCLPCTTRSLARSSEPLSLLDHVHVGQVTQPLRPRTDLVLKCERTQHYFVALSLDLATTATGMTRGLQPARHLLTTTGHIQVKQSIHCL
jgi:hypothetical protein